MVEEFVELLKNLTIEQQNELKKIMLVMLSAHTQKIGTCCSAISA